MLFGQSHRAVLLSEVLLELSPIYGGQNSSGGIFIYFDTSGVAARIFSWGQLRVKRLPGRRPPREDGEGFKRYTPKSMKNYKF